MKGKTVILGVTGGIAAYKAAMIASSLVRAGCTVKVIMTEAATRFVAPLTFQTLTHQPVVVDMFRTPEKWDVAHVSYAKVADLILIAPTTANVVGKLALGLADDMLTATVLASSAPVLIAPAMNSNMYLNPAVQHNLRLLRQRGFHIVEPGSGYLACGDVGPGRLADPDQIVQAARQLMSTEVVDLTGWNVLVTAGPTREPLDPVRYLSNRSTGRMGYALAAAAADGGAKVTLISGPTMLPTPAKVERIDVVTAKDMYQAVKDRFSSATVLIMAAAVADFRPTAYSTQKIKKQSGQPSQLELEPTVDILASLTKEKKPDQITVGFAAESEDLVVHAQHKLQSKKLDFIVANDITRTDAGFAVDTNEVIILWPDGRREHLPLAQKKDIAVAILKRVLKCRQDLLARLKK
ncbi:MAG: bifunctional phosphopantothenoylcysteine decarboxylase/phosphopantothenate--cysteine ligase CoaBC [bacterium]|jgi:phosphopantothenoylcysteine decarboxylase/phosphopantothenate--cysteine ligase